MWDLFNMELLELRFFTKVLLKIGVIAKELIKEVVARDEVAKGGITKEILLGRGCKDTPGIC